MSLVAFQTLLYREVKRFMRIIGQTLITPLVTTFLYLFIFGVGLGGQIETQSGIPYLHFVIPGLIMMGVINNSFVNPSFSLMLSKVYGDIEDLKVTPLTTNSIVWSMSFAAAFRGILVGAVVFFLAELFLFFQMGAILFPKHFISLLVITMMASITFAFIGFASGMISKNFEMLNAIVQFLILPLIYLGGVFFPLENLHVFWQIVSRFNPIFYYINGIRYCFIGISDVSFFQVMIMSIVFLLISYGISFWIGKKASYKHIG